MDKETKRINNTELAKAILDKVYLALEERGYDPLGQIANFLMTCEPTFITNHKKARSLIMKVDRETLLEVLLTNYFCDKKEESE